MLCGSVTGWEGATHGERQCLVQVSTLKKSRGRCFPVFRSIKHWPSSGRKTKDVRNEKFA